MDTIATYNGKFSDPFTEEEYIDFKCFLYKLLEPKAKENNARLLSFVIERKDIVNNTYIPIKYTFKFENGETQLFEEYIEVK